MPDEVQDLARAVAANVVSAMGTASWSHVRATLLDVLARHTSDPATTAWVDSFGTMIATADGREQNSLRDAAYARCEAVIAGLLAARPDAAADIASLSRPPQGFPGPQAPQHHAPPAPHAPHAPQSSQPSGSPGLDFAKDSAPQQSPAAPSHAPPPAPGGVPPIPPGQFGSGQPGQSGPGQVASNPSAPNPYAPSPGPFTPGQFSASGQPAPGPFGAGAPPVPPGQSGPGQPGAGPYGAPSFGGPYPGAPGSGPYQGAPGTPPGPAHAGARGGTSNNRMVIGGIVAVAVVAGAIFGGIALFGGDDDDKCSSAAPAALTPDDCGGSIPGANGEDSGGGSGGSGGSSSSGSSGSSGGSGSSSGDVAGDWAGRYVIEKPIQRNGSFTVTFVQHQNRLTGRLDLSAPGCDLSGPVVGEIDGDEVTLRSGASATDKITLEGKLSGNEMSGTYTTNCEGAEGTWTAEKE